MNKRTNVKSVILMIGIFIIIFLSLITNSYYQNVQKQLGATGIGDAKVYRYHYVMIVEDSEMKFWKDVFRSVKEAAEEQDALVELMGGSMSSDLEVGDYIEMSIAAKVDGIILEYIGNRRLERRIAEAEAAGIPVVTVLEDAPNTSRKSYVGINAYQLGQQYGEQVLRLVEGRSDQTEVMVLTHNGSEDKSQSQIFDQIYNMAMTADRTGGPVHVVQENMRTIGKVDADEAIRNIFFRPEGTPDVLVCLDSVDTEAAYQAMIDYNKVGSLELVGYYQSPQIMNAVKKGNIPVTLIIDTDEMGRYCVQALTEYLKDGRVNSFYSVDFHFVTKENADHYMRGE